jgi:hypothetical protein
MTTSKKNSAAEQAGAERMTSQHSLTISGEGMSIFLTIDSNK